MDCKPMKTSFKPLSEKQFSNARNQPLQNNEKPANDGQIPTRRLSRLGTYRTSLAMNYQKPSINNGLVSQRKVLSEKKIAVLNHIPSPNNYGPKKRLFIQSPVSRRLNMDRSSIMQPSNENTPIHDANSNVAASVEKHDPDVTGVDFIPDSTRLANLEHEQKLHAKKLHNLRSCSKSQFLFKEFNSPNYENKTNSHKPLSLKEFISRLDKQTAVLNSPTPPQHRYWKRNDIKTPKRPTFLSTFLSHQLETPNTEKDKPVNRNNFHDSKPNNEVVINDVKEDINNICKNLENNLTVQDTEKIMCSSNVIYEENKTLEVKNSVHNNDVRKITCSVNPEIISNNGESEKSNSTFLKNQPEFPECSLSNSIEAANVKNNETYIIDNKSPELNTESEYINDNNKTIVDGITHGMVSPKGRSPSFILNETVKVICEREDDTTETFLQNETLCLNETLNKNDRESNNNNNSNEEIKNTTEIKKIKQKLSLIIEETSMTNIASSSLHNNNNNNNKLNDTSRYDDTMQITCDLNIEPTKMIVLSTDNYVTVNKLKLFKLIKNHEKLIKNYEKLTKENEILLKKNNNLNDSLCNILKLEKTPEHIKFKDTFIDNSHKLINELKGKIDFSNCNDSDNEDKESESDCTLINACEKVTDSSTILNCTLKTPDRRMLSKSVFNQLKTDYSCLKTPKASAVKKNSCSSRKILTPHSMSLCVQEQVDQLFDD
ncbi:uncharacterized protein LOC142323691 [Lycorma delicatula]|uniref:uncharacterized protein LOC142323691 n=1 Tax=Lycorma delicatula TaxID=130591 RepID=UPI003F50DD20